MVCESRKWRPGRKRLGASYVHTSKVHSKQHTVSIQSFYFGEDLMLRRHDYNVNIAGGFGAAQLTSNYIQANRIGLPSKRRARGPDNRPILDMLMVAIDVSDVSFT
jgi:hypothetical protein